MANTTTARVDRTPTYNDVEIARLVHRAMADVQDAGRFGDRKVFIASLWTRMITIEAQTGGTLTEGATIEHFKGVAPPQPVAHVRWHRARRAADRAVLRRSRRR